MIIKDILCIGCCLGFTPFSRHVSLAWSSVEAWIRNGMHLSYSWVNSLLIYFTYLELNKIIRICLLGFWFNVLTIYSMQACFCLLFPLLFSCVWVSPFHLTDLYNTLIFPSECSEAWICLNGLNPESTWIQVPECEPVRILDPGSELNGSWNRMPSGSIYKAFLFEVYVIDVKS